MNKSIKIALKSCNEFEWKEIKQILKDFQYKTYKACNRAMTYFYTFEQGNNELKEVFEANIKDKELFGKSLGAWIENRMNEIIEGYLSSNVAQTRQFVEKRYKEDKKKGLLKGDVSISNFKRNMPLFIHSKAYKIFNDNGYKVEIGIFNKAKQEELSIKRLTFDIDKLDGNKKSTLNKIMNEVYKKGAAQLNFDKKGKLYLTISFGFEVDKKELDMSRIVGVDVGITNALTMQIWDNNSLEWDKLSWRECVLDGKELIHYRQKIEARRIALLKNSKIAEKNTGKAGHGRTKRINTVDTISDKVKNFRDTLNHKYSRYVIDFTLKHNCGCIQMEDLSGYSQGVSETLLKNWSYYDLQQKIKYKANEYGIVVNFIKPSYTSLRCSWCGCIHEENRDCKNNQPKFKCVICGHGENADINAAKNIALPDIENIIKEQLKTK